MKRGLLAILVVFLMISMSWQDSVYGDDKGKEKKDEVGDNIVVNIGSYLPFFRNAHKENRNEKIAIQEKEKRIVNHHKSYKNITVEEARNMMASMKVVLLDVRTAEEYNVEHIPNATLIPLANLTYRLNELNKKDKIIVYCRSGFGSMKASKILVENGFKRIYNMLGGIIAWKQAGYPTIKSVYSYSIELNSSMNLTHEIDYFLSFNIPVFVIFYAEWCHFCQQQLPVIKEMEEEYNGSMAFIYVNAEKNPNAATQFKVTGFPTMFFIIGKNESGYIYERFNGLTTKEELGRKMGYGESAKRGNNGNGIYIKDTPCEPLGEYCHDDIKVNNEELNFCEEAWKIGCDNPIIKYRRQRTLKIDKVFIKFGKLFGYKLAASLLQKFLTNRDPDYTYFMDPDFFVYSKEIQMRQKELEENFEKTLMTELAKRRFCCDSSIPFRIIIWKQSDFCGSKRWKYFGPTKLCPAIGGYCLNSTWTGSISVDCEQGKYIGEGEVTWSILDKYDWHPYQGKEFLRLPDYWQCYLSCCGDATEFWMYTEWTEEFEFEFPIQDLPKHCKNGEYKKFCRGDTLFLSICEKTGDGCEWTHTTIPCKNYGDNCYCGVYNNDKSCICPPPGGGDPGNDHPDEGYDISDLKFGSCRQSPGEGAKTGILLGGNYYRMMQLLDNLGISTAMVNLNFNPRYTLQYYPVLIIPTGGLYGLDSSSSFRQRLEEYVRLGGTVIVFSQQHGYEYDALPGNLNGYGWTEDVSCQSNSVYISQFHPIISGQDSVVCDISVDGYFTQYPSNATILLRRTSNTMPAMLVYNYGNGTVIASTMYPDWAYAHGQLTQDEINLTRDMMNWVEYRMDMENYGRNEEINFTATVSPLTISIQPPSLPRFDKGSTINLSINISNFSNYTVNEINFTVLDSQDNIVSTSNITVSINPNQTKMINFTFQTTNSTPDDIYFLEYILYNNDSMIWVGKEPFIIGNYTLPMFPSPSLPDVPHYIHGEAINISLNITNYNNITANRVGVEISGPNATYYVNISDCILPNQTKIVNFTFQTTDSMPDGIYSMVYGLFANESNYSLFQMGLHPGFILGNYSNYSYYESLYEPYTIRFTVIDPDKNIVKRNSVNISLLPIETKNISFNYSNATKLGIWEIRYDVYYNKTFLIDHGVKQFAVSKYAENPYGFTYQGSNITFSINSDSEYYAAGSNATFIITIWNNGDVNKNITYWLSLPHNSWLKHSSIYGCPSAPGHRSNVHDTVLVPAHGNVTFYYTVPVYTEDRLYADFYEGNETSNEYLGQASRGFYVINPHMNTKIRTDKNVYYMNENVTITLNFTNMVTWAYTEQMTLRVLNPNMEKVYEETIYINFHHEGEKINKTFNFTIPSPPRYGVYIVTIRGRTIAGGSNSTIFRLARDYSMRVNFNDVNKVYGVRDNISIEIEITNNRNFTLNTTINISIPLFSFETTTNISLLPNETAEFVYNFTIPENASIGKHYVIIWLSYDNSTTSFYFFIPASRLILSSPGNSYNAGDYFTINVTNAGGVDTTYNCSISLYDSRMHALYESSIQQDIEAGEMNTISFKIPEQAVNGTYYLVVECRDLNAYGIARLSKYCTINGIKVALNSSTDKKVYFANESISIATNITNLNGRIENATLNLKIFGWAKGGKRGRRYENANREYKSSFSKILYVGGVGANNYSSIQDAINDASDRDAIFIYNGTYYESIVVNKSVTIIGESKEGVIINGSGNVFSINAGMVNIVNLTIMNGSSGVYIYFYEGATIRNCLIRNNTNGISIGYSSNNEIIDCSIHNNENGIITFNAWNNNISYTVLYNNSENGTCIKKSNNIKIEGCNIHNNKHGIYLEEYSKNNVITGSMIYGNDYGIYTYFNSDNNLIYNNYFNNSINAWDDSHNDWYVMKRAGNSITGGSYIAGNYWHDYFGLDIDGDYIGDTLLPYNCNGNIQHGGDYWPLLSSNATVWKLIWEKNITVNISENEIKNILTTVSNNLGYGFFMLASTLYSNTSQILGISTSSFFINNDTNTTFLIETDKDAYKPNETVKIYVTIKNNANETKTYNLSIKKDGINIFSANITLNPNETYNKTLYTYSNISFSIEGKVDGFRVVKGIKVEEPKANISIIAPSIVGIAPFNVSVLIKNLGNVSIDLTVKIDETTWNVSIEKGEATLLSKTMNINRNITLNVTISGDINEIIHRNITCGENAHISINPEETYPEGIIEIPFIIENTGILDTTFNATFSIENNSMKRTFFIPAGKNISGIITFNLTRGKYLLTYISPFEKVNVTINVLSPPKFSVKSILPANKNFTIGQNVTFTFIIENTGGTEGEVLLKLFMPDFLYTNRTWIRAGEEGNISFNVIISNDLEEKDYKAIYEINGKRNYFTFHVSGAKIGIDANLDKKLYVENDTVILTLNISNECNYNLSLFARVILNDYEEIKYFNLTDNISLQFSIPASFTGRKLFYGIYMDTGRALYLNAMYVYKKENVTLYTDKQVYYMGENVTIFINTSQNISLNITAPNFSVDIAVNGSIMLNFTLPGLRTGTYYIVYSFNNATYYYPFDVIGYFARILEFNLDKDEYNQSDVIRINMDIDTNNNISSLINMYIYDINYNLIDNFSIHVNLTKGENEIEITRNFKSNYTGMHMLSYIISTKNMSLASGIELFDVLDTTPPVIIDHTPNTATTGDVFTFNATAMDNEEIAGIYVEYWYGNGSHENISMYNVKDNYWEANITVAHTLEKLHYIIYANDLRNNFNSTKIKNVIIYDNDKPVISNIIENPRCQEVSQWVNISCHAMDNIGIDNIRTIIFHPDGNISNNSLLAANNVYYYNATYTNTGTYHYYIWAKDSSGNEVFSPIRNFTIVTIDYILITYETGNEIYNANITTNFSFNIYTSSFNYTRGFIKFVNANWSIINNNSSANINVVYGKSILFNSGWNNGIAILQATYNGINDNVTFSINHSLFTFLFHEGWNFMTIPCQNTFNASLLYMAIPYCQIILSWNASEQDFIVYLPGSPYDFAIEDGKSYFIALKFDTLFSIPDIPIENVSILLYRGWNMLGWFGEQAIHVSSLFENISYCIAILKWDNEKQNFMLYVPGSPYDFIIRRGEGFIVAVSEQSIWHGIS